MSENKQEQKTEVTPPTIRREFTSNHKDPGINYVENFHRRNISTLSKADIIKALENAADKGSSDNNITHLTYVRELMSKEIFFLTSKEERKEILLKAASKDKEKQN